MPVRLTDERLCWLAVVDRLRRRKPANRWLLIALIIFAVCTLAYLNRVSLLGPDHAKLFLPLLPLGTLVSSLLAIAAVIYGPKRKDRRMLQYSLAVQTLSTRLTDDEREILRAEGTVPEWFMPEIEHERRKVKLFDGITRPPDR